MAKTSTLNIRIDPLIKKNAEDLFSNFGITITDAINIFINQSINYGGFPFALKIDKPNETTLKAMQEVEEISESGKYRFNTAEEMFEDLGI